MDVLTDAEHSQRRNVLANRSRQQSPSQTKNGQQIRALGTVREDSTGAVENIRPQQGVAQDVAQRPEPTAAAQILQPEQVSALYQQCIKLATENKITSKNTWALGLIDHLHDLVQPNDQEGDTTNFQRASVTLGAGVEIYAKRVDSVHTEAYKVMGGLSRGGGAALNEDGEVDEDAEGPEGGEGGNDINKSTRRAAMLRDVNPSSTLEPSFDSLNVKKFDIAFTVDPLFHKTSAQFDEGGARGLLLNNLSVYQGCEIFFASHRIPLISDGLQTSEAADVEVDLLPIQPHIKVAMEAIDRDAAICPALDELYSLLGHDKAQQDHEDVAKLMELVPDMERPTFDSGARPGRLDASEEATAGLQAQAAGESYGGVPGFEDNGPAEDGQEAGEGPSWMTQEQFETTQEQLDNLDLADHSEDDIGGKFDDDGDEEEAGSLAANPVQDAQGFEGSDAVAWLVSGLENLNLDGKAWAGASHWRFRTQQNPNADPELADAPAKAAPRPSARKKGEPLDFDNLPDLPPDALAIADAKDITLKTWGTKAPTLLPEDLHYKASSLAELFLLPGVPIFERRNAGQQNASSQPDYGLHGEDYAGGGGEDWDDEPGFSEGTAEGAWQSSTAAADLIEAPRKVAQIGINYARASKQVDVRALKSTLWHTIGDLHDSQQHQDASSSSEELSFQDVLAGLSEENVVGNVSDLSVHLCFICVLHLANENGLSIKGRPTLDGLHISDLPEASTV